MVGTDGAPAPSFARNFRSGTRTRGTGRTWYDLPYESTLSTPGECLKTGPSF